MRNNETMQIFRTVVNACIGTTRTINDGSSVDGDEFTLDSGMIEGIAENLATWYDEKFDSTPNKEEAENYFESVYPEV